MRPSELHQALAAVHPELAPPALVVRVAQGLPDMTTNQLREAISGEEIPLRRAPTHREPVREAAAPSTRKAVHP